MKPQSQRDGSQSHAEALTRCKGASARNEIKRMLTYSTEAIILLLTQLCSLMSYLVFYE